MADENVRFYKEFLRDNRIDVVINQNGLYEGVKLIDTASVYPTTIISVLHNNPTLNYRWLFKDALVLRNCSLEEKLKRIARIILYPWTRRISRKSILSQVKSLKDGGSHINVLSPAYIQILQGIDCNLNNISAIANPNRYTNPKLPEKEKTVLFVGRLDNRSKNVQSLISIWGAVSREFPDWILQIVGEGPNAESLKKQAEDLENIEFYGYQDPTQYYEKASILCMTSIFEGFPMTLTEAMQHGCVPIAFNSFPHLVI